MTPPGPDLRDRVLAAARRARTPGHALPDLPEISAAEAFRRAAQAFGDLLAGLPDGAWRVPVLRDLDVQGLVGHLTGVEEDLQRALAGDPDVAGADHVASTQPAAQRQLGRTVQATRAEWRGAADATLAAALDVPLEAVVPLHRMRLTLHCLLVVRAFELWTHENDVRRAVGMSPSQPDAAVLRLMTDLAVRLLPHGVARVADVAPLCVHLVLTGAGGGTWDVVLGDRSTAAGAPEVGIVADAVRFCRLVANRIEPIDLGAHLTGETGRADVVLAGAAALALD
jgi:uncharacterized protein (TIGR03083 family)